MSHKKTIAAILMIFTLLLSCSEQANNSEKILPVGLEKPQQTEPNFKTQWHWLFQKSGPNKLTKEELEIIEKITEKTTDKSNRQELPFPKQYDLLDSINQ